MPDTPSSAIDYSTDVISDVIPTGVTLFSGASGVGKTTLIASWATRFRDGKTIFGHQPRHVPFVGVLTTDRSWASHVRWFTKAGWPDIPHYSYQDDANLDWDRFLVRAQLPGLFRYGLQQLHPPDGPPPGSVVFVDTIVLFIDGNLIDYKKTAISLGHLNRFCCPRQLCCIGTAHQAKQKNDAKEGYKRPQDQIYGSTANLGYSDTQMHLNGPDEDGDDPYVFGWNPHHGPKERFELMRDSAGLFVPLPTDKNLHELQKAGILDLIHRDGTRMCDLEEQAYVRWKMSRATLWRYRDELVKQGSIAPGPTRGMIQKLLPS